MGSFNEMSEGSGKGFNFDGVGMIVDIPWHFNNKILYVARGSSRSIVEKKPENRVY